MQNQNQNQNTSVNNVSDGPLLYGSSSLDVVSAPGDSGALSLRPEIAPQPQQGPGEDQRSPRSIWKFLRRADVLVVIVALFGLIGLFLITSRDSTPKAAQADVSKQYGIVQIPLEGFAIAEDGLTFAGSNVVINGALQLNDSVILAPSLQPTGASAGQLYYDKTSNQLAYYNGTAFVTVGGAEQVVQSLGGLSGQITTGSGLNIVGGQLANSGVLSVQGQVGAVTLNAGNGIGINGTTVTNTGILSVTPGSSNVAVVNDGAGNVTIDMVGAGTGTVTSSGGTSGRVPLFTGAQNIEDSIISQSGFIVTISGDLSVVTGGLSLSNALTVSNGGTGATSLAANGVVIGGGTGALSTVSAGGPGLCFLSTVGAPTFGACPSAGGVSSLNGLTGALSVANASAAGATVTIDDASTVTKGIASFNATNFSASGGVINTIQNINSGASPTFAAVNTNAITPSGALTLGATAQNVTLQGAAVSITATNGGTVNTLTFASPAGGNKTITVPNATGTVAVSASAPLALNATGNLTCASCIVTGGAVVSLNGLAGVLSVANASGSGATITIDDATTGAKGIASFNSTNFSVSSGAVNTIQNINSGASPTFAGVNANSLSPSAALTVGATGQTFTLQGSAASAITATGGGFTTTVGFSGTPVGAVRYEFDRAPTAGTYTICSTVGNCAGTGGGVTTPNGSTNRLAKFTSAQVIGDSSITDNGSVVSTIGDLVIQGGDITIGVANSQIGTLTFAHSGSAFLGSIVQGALTGNRTYTLPDATGDVCLSSGNCLGGAGGANTSLSNLTGVAINASLLPGTAGGIDVGSGTKPFADVFLAGTSVTPATNNFRITGVATGGTKVITLPDATGTVCLQTSASCGFAPTSGSSSYIQNQIASPQTSASFNIDSQGRAVTFNATTSINTGAGAGTARIDASGNLVAIGNLTATGAITIASVGAGNDVIINGADILDVQDPTSLASTLDVTGTTTLAGDLAANGNITLGNATTDLVTLTGIIQGGSPLVFEGAAADANELTLSIATLTGDRTITLPDATGDVCLTSGNCVGVGGGVSTAGGTPGTLPVFTGAQAIGDSLVSQSGGTVTVSGNLSLAPGNQYQINGTQISSANLSNDANLAKLSASQTFTGATIAFQNGSNSTNAFNIQNSSGNRLLTLDTSGGQVILGQGSTLDGKLVFSNMTNNNTISFLVGTPTGNRNITLPNDSGTICLDSGNCAGAGATLQTAYNFSVGGTTPKIKLNNTKNGVDIQDADTTIGADLFDVRESNGSGLGQVMFGVGNTGQVTLQNGTNSTTAFRLLTDGGTSVLAGDTQNGRVILGQGSTLDGTLIFQNATNNNQTTITAAAASGPQSITLPNASGTVCLTSGNCVGVGGTGDILQGGNSFTAAMTIGTNDAFDLNLETSGVTRLTVESDGSQVTFASNVDLILQGATAYISNGQGQTASEAFGLSASVAAANAIALGNAASAGFAGSIAIGSNAATTAANQLVVGGDFGSSRHITNAYFGAGVTSASAASAGVILQATGGLGTDIGGADLTLAAGRSTGSAVGGTINLQVTGSGSSGASLNSLTTVASFSSASASIETPTIIIGGTNVATTIDIGNYGAGFGTPKTINIGPAAGSITSTINVANSSGHHTVNIGTSMDATSIVTLGNTNGRIFLQTNWVSIGDSQTGGTITLGDDMTTGTIGIGGTGAQTGAIDIGVGLGSQTISIGRNNTGTKTIYIGPDGGTTGATVNIASGFAPNTVNINNNGTGAGTSTTTIGGGNARLLLSSGNTTGSIGLGSAAAETAITVGNQTTNSALTLQAGYRVGNGITIVTGDNGTNAAGINIGNTTTATIQAISIGTNATASSTANITIGSTIAGTTAVQGATTITNRTSGSADSLIVSNSTSTGTIAVFRDNATAVATIADGGATTFQNQTNSSSAFRILNSSGEELAGVDSSSAIIRLFSGVTGHVANTTATTTFTAREGGSTVIVNGYIYVLGGCNSSGTPSAVVQYAKVNSDGTTGTWATTTSLPNASCDNAAATYNGYIYVNGGGSSDAISDDVYYAKVNSDGTITSWNTSATAVPSPRTAHAMAVYNGYLYAIGGYNGAFVGTRNVDYVKIGSDGSTGAWTTVSNWLPVGATDGESATVANGYLYVFGDSDKNQIVYGQIANDGSIGASGTVDSDTLSSSRYGGRIIALNGFLYITGGRTVSGTISTATNIISYTSLGGDGSIGAWANDTSTLSGNRQSHGIATANGYMYIVGGHDGTDEVNTTLYTSGPRVKVNGALDLTAGGGENLSDGGTGGQLTAGDTNIVGTLGVTGNITAKGGLSVLNNLTVNVAANTSSAFAVINAAGLTQFSVDTTNSRVYIGNPTADAVGALLVLDNNSGSDPAGVDGAMYYNSSMGMMRCYYDTKWRFCNDEPSMEWGYSMKEDFIATVQATPGDEFGVYAWTYTGTTGTASSVDTVAATDAKRPGILRLTSGTSGTGIAALHISQDGGNEPFLIGAGDEIEFAMKVATTSGTSGSGNEYDIRAGLCDNSTGDCVDGLYFEYDRDQSANWRIGASAGGGGTRTEVSSAIPVDTSWHRFKIVVNSTTSIDYYIDGTLVAAGPITTGTSIPSARATSPMFHVVKETGATSYLLDVDYFYMHNSFSTRRGP